MAPLDNLLLHIHIFAALCYLLAAAGYARLFLGGGASPRPGPTAILAAGAALQGIGIAVTVVGQGRAPFLGLRESFAFLGFLVAVHYNAVQRLTREKFIGLIITPFVLALVLLRLLPTPSRPLVRPEFTTPWFLLHVTFAFLGYAAFVISFATALMYLLLARQIKAKRLGKVFAHFPPLGTLDRITFISAAVGVGALALGILFGMVRSYGVRGRLLTGDPKEVGVITTWMVYAAYLHSRLMVGWGGGRAAAISIAGFAMVLFTYIIVSVFWSRVHSFL